MFWIAVVLSLVGIPYLGGLLLRLAMTGYEQLPPARRLAAVGVVLVVAVLAFTPGHFNNLFMTCSDFTVSGNFTPTGCIPGQGTLSG